MGNLTHTVSGDIASFRSAARVPIESLKCHFKPKQDLHGYDKPWPSGGGKNLFNWNVSEQNPDDTTTANTTARIFTPNTYCVGTSWSNWWQPNQIVSYSISNGTIIVQNNNVYGIGFAFKLAVETTYVIGATATNGGISVAYYDNTGTYITTSSANILNSSFTTPANADITILTFYTTNTSENGVFTDIQLEKGSSKTSYEPYENICPIEGWNNIIVSKITGDYNITYLPGTTTSYNVTFTVDNNGFVTASGTPTSYSSCNYGIIDVEGNETLYGTIFGSLNNITWNKPILYDSNDNTIPTSLPDNILNIGLDLSQFQGVKKVRIALKRNLNNIPMNGYCSVVIGKNRKIAPDTLPITFPTTGKNKFNSILINGNINADGTINNDATSNRICSSFVPISHGTYTISNYENYPVAVYIYGSENEEDYLSDESQIYWNNTPFTFTINNGKYVCFKWKKPDESSMNLSDISQIQLELNTEKTSYEPYNPNNTVYGGYVDIAKGEVVATHKIIDLATLTWTTYASTTGGAINRIRSDIISDLALSETTSTVPDLVAEQFYPIPSGYNFTNYPTGISIHPSNRYFYKYFDGEHYPQGKIVYRLTTPIQYPISKTELKTFLDQNNIWSNTNDIAEVSYQIHDSNMIHNTKLAMMAHSHDLPPAYQQYDYLRTSGSNTRINTGVTGDDTTLQIECEFKFTQIDNSYIGVFGNYKNENAAYCWRIILPNISTYPEPKFLYATTGNGTPGNGNGLSGTMAIYPYRENNANAPFINQKVKILMSYGYCRVISSTNDYSVTATNKNADANTNNICLGAMSTTSTGGTTQCRIYSFKLYSQNHLVRNYVPCVRKSDSKAGFYDLVNHTFNSSIGSVEFVAGNEE